MAFLSIIRRWALREHLSVRQIARRTKLSRNTIRSYLRSGAVEPKFSVPGRPGKLDPHATKLAVWLKTEAGKSRKQRRTAKQLHEDLVKLGYTGSYGRVAAFARAWKAERQREQQTTGRGTFVPLVFQPGEAFRFDWSEDFAVPGGERTKLQVAHIKLSHSRAFLLRAYPLQTHDLSHRARTDGATMASMFDAHVHAFRVFGGVPARGIHDSEAGPPSVQSPAERALLSIVSAGARSGRSMPGFQRWPAIMSSSPRSAVLLRVGRKVRSRRTFRIHGTGFGSRCRTFPTLPR